MSNGNSINLTATKIASMKLGDELWDADPHGLFVRAGKRGNSFQYAYRFYGKPHKIGIGIVSLAQARVVAKKYRDMVADGVNPQDVREDARQKAPPATLADLEQRWEKEAQRCEREWETQKEADGYSEKKMGSKKDMAFQTMKPPTIEKYRGYWTQIHNRLGGDKKLTALTLQDITDMHNELSVKVDGERKGPKRGGLRQANLIVNFLASNMKMAVIWGLLEDSERNWVETLFKKVRRNKEYKREKFLKEDDLPKFYAQLEKLKNPDPAETYFHKGKHRPLHSRIIKDRQLTAFLIEMLLTTDSRIKEYMSGRLSAINWAGKIKTIRVHTKTGMRTIPIGDAAVELLKARAEQWHKEGANPENDWIMPSNRKKGAPLTSPYKGWRKFLTDAGLDKALTPHTVRHSLITYAQTHAGQSREQAGAMAGHRNLNTTTRYTHTVEAAVVDTINKTVDVMRALGRKEAAPDTNDDNVPDFIKTQRENNRKLQEITPQTTAH